MFDSNLNLLLFMSMFFIMIMGISVIMLSYLRTSRTNNFYGDRDKNEKIEKIEKNQIETNNEINRLITQIENINNGKYTKEDINLIIREFKKDNNVQELLKNIKNDILDNTDNEIKEKFNNIQAKLNSLEHNQLIEIELKNKNEESLILYLTEQLETFKRMANVNLIFGSIITMVVFGFLIYTMFVVIDISQSNNNNENFILLFLTIFIPRFILAFFMQLFGLFFLKLYKSCLKDIGFAQNELTTIASKILALNSAFLSKNIKTTHDVITDLSKIERNFLIPKKYTTQRIELEKISNKESENLAKDFKEILNTFKTK